MPSIKNTKSPRYKLLFLCFMSIVLIAFNSCSKTIHSSQKNKNTKTEKPNIVFILTDDLGYGDLSCFGSKTISTPNIDKLSDEGITFTNFYVSNRCTPSRMSFMTGAYAERIELSRVLYWFDRMGIHENEITTPELLKEVGYSTGIIGKWHLGNQDEFHPNKHGFDDFYGFVQYGRHETGIYRNNVLEETIKKKTHGKHSPKLVREAVNFIEKNKDKPFFLYYASPLPHHPFLPSDRFKGTSKNGTYGDQVQDIDWQVSEIMKTLKENGLDDNTLVVFASDNGPQIDLKHHGNSGILKDGKWSNYEGGIRVPCIMRWPKQIPKGIVNDEIVGIIDMLPTFSSVAKGRIPNDRIIDGKNLLPYMQGKKLETPLHETYYVAGKVIRDGNFKYAYRPIEPGGPRNNWVKWGNRTITPKGTIFDVVNDPGETTNVSSKHPGKAEEMKQKMETFLAELNKNKKPIGKTWDYSDELLKAEWKRERAPKDQKEHYLAIVDSILKVNRQAAKNK